MDDKAQGLNKRRHFEAAVIADAVLDDGGRRMTCYISADGLASVKR